jgi:hypothetical protein
MMNFNPNRPEKPDDDPLLRRMLEISDRHVTIQNDLRRSVRTNTVVLIFNTVCLGIISAWVVGATLAHMQLLH